MPPLRFPGRCRSGLPGQENALSGSAAQHILICPPAVWWFAWRGMCRGRVPVAHEKGPQQACGPHLSFFILYPHNGFQACSAACVLLCIDFMAWWSVLVHTALQSLLPCLVVHLLLPDYSLYSVVLLLASGRPTLVLSIATLLRKKQSVYIFFIGL